MPMSARAPGSRTASTGGTGPSEDAAAPTPPADDELEASLKRLERQVESAKDLLSTLENPDEDPPPKPHP